MQRFVIDTICLSLIFILTALAPMAWGQVRSSGLYQMERDSFNVGGGEATSSSYQLNDTAGDIATGRSTSSSYILDAGYQQQDYVVLTLTGGDDVVMDTAIGGITGGTSNGSTTINASTNGAAGYQLTIQASASPAMQSPTSTIADYVPAGGTADAAFVTDPSDAHFAFSPFGPDTASRYLVSGSTCGSGSASTTACWDGLSTSPVTIASAPGSNIPNGATTTVYFKVGIGSAASQLAGTYVATTTITLLSL